MTHKYNFISDPGHGWIAVPLVELRALGIAEQISEYSYILGATVYLEEDCDAALFVKAKTAATGEKPQFIEHFQDPCPIREYPHYMGERGVKRARSATVRPNAFAHLFN